MILCDTGPLVAAFNSADRDHVRCARFPGRTGHAWWFPRWRSPRSVGSFLGFVFAEGVTHHQVETALRAARERLRVVIE